MERSNKNIRMFKSGEIHMRDPFVLADDKRKLYFLFGTTAVADGAANIDPFFEVFVSEDLINFEGPYAAFQPKKGFWGVKHFWAPEVHEYKGSYYMFASCKGGIKEDRGTGVFISEKPEGPYLDLSQGHVTLKGHECLDGTLLVDKMGQPWIVFCHEWTELFYGKIVALPLKEDLSGTLTQEAVVIVDTQKDNIPWIRQMCDARVDKTGYLTDAPFFYKAKSGKLIMLWSSYSIAGYGGCGQGNYVVAMVSSPSGDITGPWQHEKDLLLDADIGHVSLFRDFSGQLMLCGHGNDTKHGSEHPIFIPIIEEFDTIYVKQ